ncbi:hypothetical protein SLEP1_g30628 [Rubroshorea leprosula]|uniref:Uncharacterized protein n=1 Tax=Rubroshorea leprosula TaxID=152421 RepID=A0AAV5K8Y0_9ROSI|nr:hypothetical protein SLEP1_g30628 [Rubroshorea leprosula]
MAKPGFFSNIALRFCSVNSKSCTVSSSSSSPEALFDDAVFLNRRSESERSRCKHTSPDNWQRIRCVFALICIRCLRFTFGSSLC